MAFMEILVVIVARRVSLQATVVLSCIHVFALLVVVVVFVLLVRF